MSYLNFLGLESADLSQLGGVGGSGTYTVEISDSSMGGFSHTAVFSLKTAATGTGTAYGYIRTLASNGGSTFFNTTLLYGTVYFTWHTKPSSGDEEILCVTTSAGTYVFSIRIGSDGKLAAYKAGTTLLGTGSTVLDQYTWYRIEFLCEVAADGDWYVKVDGVTEASGTSDFGATAMAQVGLGKKTNRNGNSVEFYYDDICVDNASAIGPVAVTALGAMLDGYYTDWTGDHNDVEDTPHDGDTTYIYTATSGHAYTAQLSGIDTFQCLGSILAVKTVSICREAAAFASAFQTRLRSGTTDDDTASRDVGGTYSVSSKIYVTDPATGLPWVRANMFDAGAVECGVEANNSSGTYRCTSLRAEVLDDTVPPVGVRRVFVC